MASLAINQFWPHEAFVCTGPLHRSRRPRPHQLLYQAATTKKGLWQFRRPFLNWLGSSYPLPASGPANEVRAITNPCLPTGRVARPDTLRTAVAFVAGGAHHGFAHVQHRHRYGLGVAGQYQEKAVGSRIAVHGLFVSWRRCRLGTVQGEGAAGDVDGIVLGLAVAVAAAAGRGRVVAHHNAQAGGAALSRSVQRDRLPVRVVAAVLAAPFTTSSPASVNTPFWL